MIKIALVDGLEHCGKIVQALVFKSARNGRKHAYVDFSNAEELAQAMEMGGSELAGGLVTVVRNTATGTAPGV